MGWIDRVYEETYTGLSSLEHDLNSLVTAISVLEVKRDETRGLGPLSKKAVGGALF